MFPAQRHPARDRRQACTHGHDRQEPHHHRLRGVGAGQQAHRHRGDGIGGGRQQHHQAGEGNQPVHPRAQHHDHPEQADADRGPAPWADLLAQQRHRQRRHQQRRDEVEGVGGGQWHAPERVHEATDHHHAQHAAQQVQAPANRHDRAHAGAGQHPHQHERQRRRTPQQGHLQRRVMGRQQLHARIHQREAGHGGEHPAGGGQGGTAGRVHGRIIAPRPGAGPCTGVRMRLHVPAPTPPCPPSISSLKSTPTN